MFAVLAIYGIVYGSANAEICAATEVIFSPQLINLKQAKKAELLFKDVTNIIDATLKCDKPSKRPQCETCNSSGLSMSGGTYETFYIGNKVSYFRRATQIRVGCWMEKKIYVKIQDFRVLKVEAKWMKVCQYNTSSI